MIDFSHANPLEVARYLVSQGISVIPIDVNTKKPAVKWKAYQDRFPTDKELCGWFSNHPYQVGIVCGKLSGIVIWDCDTPEAIAWTEANMPYSPLWTDTPGGGCHYWYRYPPGTEIGNSRRDWVLPPYSEVKADIRGHGGQALAPGALHHSGGRYQLGGGSLPLTRESIDACPHWPVDQLTPPPVTPAPRGERYRLPGQGVNENGNGWKRPEPYERAQKWLKFRDPAIEGQGGDLHTYCTACALVRGFSLSDGEALELMLGWNLECRPQWRESELRVKVASARKYGKEPFGYLLDQESKPREESPLPTHDAGPPPLPEPPEEAPQLEKIEPLGNRNPPWPAPLDRQAFHGLAGEVVDTILPHTEGDEACILFQFLAVFGHLCGRGAHYMVESTMHGPNIIAVVVGNSGDGRKGTAYDRIDHLFRLAAAGNENFEIRLCSGLGSGEGLILRVQDVPGRSPEEDHLLKRALLLETEFASILRVSKRDGNLLSQILRNAWDGKTLSNSVKNNPLRSSNHHISGVGHITPDEMRVCLTGGTEITNGFANRMLWICVKRSKFLPFGGDLGDDELRPLALKVREVLRWVRKQRVRRWRFDRQAAAIWETIYPQLSSAAPGASGVVLGRAAAQVIRLSLIFALLDCSRAIRAVHLLAALACWNYCIGSTLHLFGDRLSDQVADTLLDELRSCPEGLTRSDIRDLFGRHKSSAEISRGIGILQDMGLAFGSRSLGKGRPIERWFASPGVLAGDKSLLSLLALGQCTNGGLSPNMQHSYININNIYIDRILYEEAGDYPSALSDKSDKSPSGQNGQASGTLSEPPTHPEINPPEWDIDEAEVQLLRCSQAGCGNYVRTTDAAHPVCGPCQAAVEDVL